jgi:Phage gp6-like head-tail connector protein
MVDTILKVLTPADSFDLLTLDELKDMLGIADTDTTQDDQLATYITQFSDIIARECNRTFAYEEMRETVRCLQPRRYYTSHWPVKEDDIESIETPRGEFIDPSTYEVEEESGKIEFFGSRSEPIVVTYFGGYHLPDEAPPALKAACEMCIRDARTYAARQAVSGIRSISHKESRVMYFDVNAALGKNVGTPMDFVSDMVRTLLYHYMRFWV